MIATAVSRGGTRAKGGIPPCGLCRKISAYNSNWKTENSVGTLLKGFYTLLGFIIQEFSSPKLFSLITGVFRNISTLNITKILTNVNKLYTLTSTAIHSNILVCQCVYPQTMGGASSKFSGRL